MTLRLVRNGECEIAVYEDGRRGGETILLCHGWPDNHEMWNEVKPYLVDQFRVLSVDNRGHGQSTKSPDRSFSSAAKLAGDYAAVIDAMSPGKPVHIIAHDWGSAAVWELVSRADAAQYVASFVSVAGPAMGHFADTVRSSFANRSLTGIAKSLAQIFLFSYMPFLTLPFVPKMLSRFASEKLLRRGVSLLEGIPQDRVHVSAECAEDMAGGVSIYRAAVRSDLWRGHSAPVSVPVAAFVGSRDPVIRRFSYGELTQCIGQAKLVVLKGGHWLPLSRPAEIASAAIELIQNRDATPAVVSAAAKLSDNGKEKADVN
ncbi:Probable oxidoreductase EphD [Mycobacteroides abscessus subsp. abscessus]|uniref:alpha/beta fold hydrolase n=1 Tax=Mycobacteroides abscessus TaxID=36809 RepID=UPI000929B7A8|nr:alpha/beta fold hydrolase [Mycobacteroides abscessus]SIL80627.1 Probable oxidoreductase EphD [Mycobacteroides abscessus subsp. abscessus]SLF08326.1 Probable oxidoreductase EphD [Mycobacteroides abscessus subsp. abscessus]